MNPMEQEKQLAQKRIEANDTIRHLEALLSSDGWKVFDKYMAGVEQSALQKTKDATSPEMPKHFASWLTVKDVRAWPELFITNCRRFLEEDAKRSQQSR